jgi:hypothetical protein
MRIARVLAAVAVAGLIGAACVPPPPPPPPLGLADLNGFFTGTSSYVNGEGCFLARELFFNITYALPNRAREVNLDIDGCVEQSPSVDDFTYNGTFVIDTAVGRLTGKAVGLISIDDGTHELRLTVKASSGDWQAVRGTLRNVLVCDCGAQDPQVPIPVRGVLAAHSSATT